MPIQIEAIDLTSAAQPEAEWSERYPAGAELDNRRALEHTTSAPHQLREPRLAAELLQDVVGIAVQAEVPLQHLVDAVSPRRFAMPLSSNARSFQFKAVNPLSRGGNVAKRPKITNQETYYNEQFEGASPGFAASSFSQPALEGGTNEGLLNDQLSFASRSRRYLRGHPGFQ